MPPKDKNTKIFYRLHIDDDSWVIEKETLETNIADWVEENGEVKVSLEEMTQEQFDKLPED